MFSHLTRRSATLVVIAGIIVIGGPVLMTSTMFRRPSLRQDEVGFRARARYSVSPRYPPGLVPLLIEGVAVAQVRVQPDGNVGDVEVLESPHEEISRAVVAALRQWRFPVAQLPTSYLAARVRGKVTYYFAVEWGMGVVRAPEEQAQVRQMAKD